MFSHSSFTHSATHRAALAALALFCLSVQSTAQTIASPQNASVQQKSAQSTDLGLHWEKLTSAQQQALRPIQSDWASLDAARKKKWLAVAQRFAAMPPEDQAQMHSRMQAWSQLSPAQRQSARDSYTQALSSPNSAPAQGSTKANLNEQWIKYQALPPERRAALKAAAENAPTVPAAPFVKTKPLGTTTQ